MVLVCLPTHTRNPAIRFTPLQCEHCTHPTSILLPNGQLSVFTVCEPVLSSSVRALPKATVRAGMVLTGAEYCYRAFSQCLFTVQEWGLLLKSGRRSGFATASAPRRASSRRAGKAPAEQSSAASRRAEPRRAHGFAGHRSRGVGAIIRPEKAAIPNSRSR